MDGQRKPWRQLTGENAGKLVDPVTKQIVPEEGAQAVPADQAQEATSKQKPWRQLTGENAGKLVDPVTKQVVSEEIQQDQ